MKIKHCFQTLGTFSHAITNDSPCHPRRDMYDKMHLRNQAPIRIQLGRSAEELPNLHSEVLTFVLGGDRGENVIQNCEQIEVIKLAHLSSPSGTRSPTKRGRKRPRHQAWEAEETSFAPKLTTAVVI